MVVFAANGAAGSLGLLKKIEADFKERLEKFVHNTSKLKTSLSPIGVASASSIRQAAIMMSPVVHRFFVLRPNFRPGLPAEFSCLFPAAARTPGLLPESL